jgi:hypothetical protein
MLALLYPQTYECEAKSGGFHVKIRSINVVVSLINGVTSENSERSRLYSDFVNRFILNFEMVFHTENPFICYNIFVFVLF